jgi:MOSC domain-containing protein YiiM
MPEAQGLVVAVARDGEHRFSKTAAPTIRLLTGLGVEGDAHCGVTVRHRSRVKRDPTQPNLRQVHLIHAELIDELVAAGFEVGPATMGENITTRGMALLELPTGTRLRIGADAVVEITGLRNPCFQLDNYQAGLTHAVLDRGPDGELIRKAGVMGIVLAGGEVTAGNAIVVDLPAGPHRRLEPV